MNSFLLHIFIACIGVVGFSIATYISLCKKKKKPLVCPLRTSCNFVTTSDYSKFLGIHVEYLGMAYYAFVTLLHLLLAFSPYYVSDMVFWFGLLVSIGAFLFSVYLTSVQAFVLKQWCTWCIFSATLCVIIVLATYYSWVTIVPLPLTL